MICVHTHFLIWLFSDALFFNAGTISVFKSVIQFNCILISKCQSTVLPRCDKHSTAVFHMPLLLLSNIFSHLLLRAGLSALHYPPANRGGQLWLLQRASHESNMNIGEGHERESLQTISGLRSPFFGPEAWKLYFDPWLSLSVPLEPKTRTNASILSHFNTYYFNHINYSILAVTLLRI